MHYRHTLERSMALLMGLIVASCGGDGGGGTGSTSTGGSGDQPPADSGRSGSTTGSGTGQGNGGGTAQCVGVPWTGPPPPAGTGNYDCPGHPNDPCVNDWPVALSGKVTTSSATPVHIELHGCD